MRKEMKRLNLNLTELITMIKDYSNVRELMGVDLKKRPVMPVASVENI